MDFFTEVLVLLGRICISALFLWSASKRIKHWHATMEQFKLRKVPHIHILLPVAVALEIVGGLLVLSGFYCRFGALLLLICVIPTLYWLHNFWNHKDVERKLELMFFMKGIAIIGGLLLLMAVGPGRLSL